MSINKVIVVGSKCIDDTIISSIVSSRSKFRYLNTNAHAEPPVEENQPPAKLTNNISALFEKLKRNVRSEKQLTTRSKWKNVEPIISMVRKVHKLKWNAFLTFLAAQYYEQNETFDYLNIKYQ